MWWPIGTFCWVVLDPLQVGMEHATADRQVRERIVGRTTVMTGSQDFLGSESRENSWCTFYWFTSYQLQTTTDHTPTKMKPTTNFCTDAIFSNGNRASDDHGHVAIVTNMRTVYVRARCRCFHWKTSSADVWMQWSDLFIGNITNKQQPATTNNQPITASKGSTFLNNKSGRNME